tara:strand:+ start:68 stop:1045 length:978 start_codon:yes stop_codon:yes gene_type:complete
MYSTFDFEKPFIEKAIHGKLELVYTSKNLNDDTVALAEGFDGISLFTSDIANATILEKLYLLGIKYIALRTVGHDHIDLKKAKSLGIKVANVPEYSPFSIAEQAVALLMALNRKIVLGQKLMEMGDYRLDNLVGFDLHGKTVGIIGTGKIGHAFAKIMHGFGCNLLGFDPIKNEELIQQTHIQYCNLEELCQNADIISVHCPMNTDSKYMFNKSLFSKMKKGVVFINTSRGMIVNTEDLIEALNNGIVAAAGLDVYEKEKTIFFQNHITEKINDPIYTILRSLPNVLITGHQGFLTNEALQGIANTTIANFNAWAFNNISKNEIE